VIDVARRNDTDPLMKPARLAVLAIAVLAAGAAVFLVQRINQAPAPIVVEKEPEPVRAPTNQVLVAAGDLSLGQTIQDGDVAWQPWPVEAMNGAYIKEGGDKTKADIVGSIVRSPFSSGEPIRSDKLIKGGNAGFMSAILPSGKRAVAISIDTRGASTAGGFILPNDHVDVIRTYRDDEASRASGTEVQVSETVLTNVRVLAIGQNVQEKNGEKVVIGETATLELNPREAELVVLAQRVGQLSLALRSLADSRDKSGEGSSERDSSTAVIRYGVQTQTIRK